MQQVPITANPTHLNPRKHQALLDSLERNGDLIRKILTALETTDATQQAECHRRIRPGSAPVTSAEKASPMPVTPTPHHHPSSLTPPMYDPTPPSQYLELTDQNPYPQTTDEKDKPPLAPQTYTWTPPPAVTEADTVATWVKRARGARPQSAPVSRHGALAADLEVLQRKGRGEGGDACGEFEDVLQRIVESGLRKREERGRVRSIGLQERVKAATSRLKQPSPVDEKAGRWQGSGGVRVRPGSAPVRGKRPGSAKGRGGGGRAVGEGREKWVVSGIGIG